MRRPYRICAIVLGLFASARAEAAVSVEQAMCLDAIQTAEHSARLPTRLLNAIGIVESGRLDPLTGRFAPWPWTINVAGEGHFYPNMADAIAAVQAARAAGIQSIDVGCMQINLLHHPAAFTSLEQAFDPSANARYAATFLSALFVQTGNWGAAAGAYHSQTPELSVAYRQRVAVSWPAAAIGLTLRDVSRLPASRLQLDPRGQEMPELRARLARDAADRAARISRGLAPPVPARSNPGRLRLALPTLQASLARQALDRQP